MGKEREVIAGYEDGELMFLQGHNPVTGLPLWTSDIDEARIMTPHSAYWSLYAIQKAGAPDMEGLHCMTYAQAMQEARRYA